VITPPGSSDGTVPEERTESDIPVWLKDSPPSLETEDAFGVGPFVDRLVHVVARSEPPFTLSLSGSWGIGKSTVAQALITRLREEGTPACLVDAWTEDVEHLRRTIAIEVGAELGGGTTEARDRVAKSVDSAMRVSVSETLPPEPQLELESAVARFKQRPELFVWFLAVAALLVLAIVWTGSWSPDVARGVSTLFGAFLVLAVLQTGYVFRVRMTSQSQAPAEESVQMADRFRSIVAGGSDDEHTRVLVVVDNLDRLPGDEALRALGEIRALVEIPGSRCIFLIPLDRRAFVGHIQQALTAQVSARDYLDKFFNLDLLLTQPEPIDLRLWALQRARQLFGHVVPAEELQAAVQVVASAANGSPRSVIRVLNGVSTRRRLLDPQSDPQPTLAEMAFVEGIVTGFPQLISWIESVPRHLEDLRSRLAGLYDRGAQETVINEVLTSSQIDPATISVGALRSFLLANVDVGAGSEVLRVALSLRDDRFWRGVPNPRAIRDALATAQAGDLAEALKSLDDETRRVAWERIRESINRSGATFSRDAMSALLAVAPVARESGDFGRLLRPTAADVVMVADTTNRARITEDLAEYLFGGDGLGLRAKELARLLATTVVETPAPNVTIGLVRAICLASPELDEAGALSVRESLGHLDDATLGPLFDTPVRIRLIEGPIIGSMVERSTAVDLADVSSEDVDVVRRLGVFTGAHGADASMSTIAAAMATQVSASDFDPNDLAFEFLDELARALPRTADESIEGLAEALEDSGHARRGELLASAIQLPNLKARYESLAQAVDAWIAEPATPAAEVHVLINRWPNTLAKYESEYADILAKRWTSDPEPGFAVLLSKVMNDGAGLDVLLDTLGGSAVPVSAFCTRAFELLDLVSTDKERLEAFVAVVGKWTAAAEPASEVGTLAPILVRLEELGVPPDAIARAISERISNADTADIQLLAVAARRLEEGGWRSAARLARPIAARLSALGVSESASVVWLARRSSGSTDAVTATIRVIQDTSVSVSDLVPLLDSVRRPLKSSGRVRNALVERALQTGDPDQAQSLLTEATHWRTPAADQKLAYRTNLEAIASTWPELTDLVNKLHVD
jgi:hypothetical protein